MTDKKMAAYEQLGSKDIDNLRDLSKSLETLREIQLKKVKSTKQDTVDIIGRIVTDFQKIPEDVKLRLLSPYTTKKLEFAISSAFLITVLREEIGGIILHKFWHY